ncbi:MAG: GTPase HflX, partial [Gammaproteobacteria bacterium]|nr:GTPase HflX [Gammaproteobacteria bacterium]
LKQLGFDEKIGKPIRESLQNFSIELMEKNKNLIEIQKEHYAENGDMVLTLRMQRQDFKRALARADMAESRFLEPVQEAWH